MKKKKQNSDLTAREMDVLKEMISGKSNKKIGKTLFITQYTVKAHLTQIYKKFGVTNRIEAAMKARDKGIIPHQDSEQP